MVSGWKRYGAKQDIGPQDRELSAVRVRAPSWEKRFVEYKNTGLRYLDIDRDMVGAAFGYGNFPEGFECGVLDGADRVQRVLDGLSVQDHMGTRVDLLELGECRLLGRDHMVSNAFRGDNRAGYEVSARQRRLTGCPTPRGRFIVERIEKVCYAKNVEEFRASPTHGDSVGDVAADRIVSTCVGRVDEKPPRTPCMRCAS